MFEMAMAAASAVMAIGTLIRSVMPVIMAWKKGARGSCKKFDGFDDVSAWKGSAYDVRVACIATIQIRVTTLDFHRYKHLRLAKELPKTPRKSYSTVIDGEPPASRMTSAISSASTRAPLAVSGATKLIRSVDTENVSLVRKDVILRQT